MQLVSIKGSIFFFNERVCLAPTRQIDETKRDRKTEQRDTFERGKCQVKLKTNTLKSQLLAMQLPATRGTFRYTLVPLAASGFAATFLSAIRGSLTGSLSDNHLHGGSSVADISA